MAANDHATLGGSGWDVTNPIQGFPIYHTALVKAGAFVAADIPVGQFVCGRDTVGNTTKMYYNNAGTLMSVSLT